MLKRLKEEKLLGPGAHLDGWRQPCQRATPRRVHAPGHLQVKYGIGGKEVLAVCRKHNAEDYPPASAEIRVLARLLRAMMVVLR